MKKFNIHSHTTSLLPGLFAVFLLAWGSVLVTQYTPLPTIGISSLVCAILLGILGGNIISLPHGLTPGIQFSAKKILRLAIVLYGFRISVQEIIHLGWTAFLLDVFVVSVTLIGGWWVGRRIFKLDNMLALLISGGAAICGAAAVLAMEDILKSPPHKTVVAIGTVVLFGTLSMLIYPVLYHMHAFDFTPTQFGLFAGASIHEVAQVVVAGADVGPAIAKIAVIVKMMRVLLLVPALVVISLVYNRWGSSTDKTVKWAIPWFALGFIAMILVNSMGLLSENTLSSINQVDTFLLTMAMGAIGLETKWHKVKHVGAKPLYFAIFLSLWLMVSVTFMVHCLT